MMRKNADLRPGKHAVYIETGEKYTIDGVCTYANSKMEINGQRFVNFHLTGFYNLGMKCMEMDDFKQAFEMAKDNDE